MQNLNIGQIIYNLRKEKGVTQEKLAEFLEVSTPAVSKWETGQSYPDITLLPELASYFNVSIDLLMDFAPDISKEDTMSLYQELSNAFATEEFEPVLARCKSAVKKYSNSYFLHLQIGNLLMNHLDRAPAPEALPELLDYAISLFRRVVYGTTDANLVHQARYSMAICCIMAGKADEAEAALEPAVDSLLPKELVMAQVYQVKGDISKAKGTLQGYLFQCLVGIVNAAPALSQLCADQPEIAEKWLTAGLKAIDAFAFEEANPFGAVPIHLTAAHFHAAAGQKEKAGAALERLAAIVCNPDNYPVKFGTSPLFDSMEQLYKSLDLGDGAHRSDKTIKESLLRGLSGDPALATLADTLCYQRIISALSEA